MVLILQQRAFPTAPLSNFNKRKCEEVLFDAREYYPRQNEGEMSFELYEKRGRIKLCREFLPQCDAVVTVSEGSRQEYLRVFGIAAEVYRSTPSYVDLQRTLRTRILSAWSITASRTRTAVWRN